MTNIQPISVDRIFLDLSNPRHEPYRTEGEVIEYLCREEQIYGLAKDIVLMGLNPLEVFALMPLKKGKVKPRQTSFVVAEGNRRMCAIKLLNDPDLAPANQRKDFKKLAEKFTPVTKVLGVVFDDKKLVDSWLDRIHGGVQGGIGRKPWNAEQKTRHIGDKKNVVAQAILDYAEKQGILKAEDRKGKLTTAQRYLGNAFLRETLGIDNSNIDDISRDRPKADFDILLRKFMDDLISGAANSRANAEDIKKYSRSLGATKGITGKRGAPESLSVSPSSGKKKRKQPKKPDKPRYITYEDEISQKLKEIPSYKLEHIYHSLCDIALEEHTPLISVGVWSFFESLTARAGRNSDTAFPDFLSKNKLNGMGFTTRESVNSIRQALSRVSDYGNTTKHSDKSANFNGEQLANDMDVLKDVICKLATEAKGNGK